MPEMRAPRALSSRLQVSIEIVTRNRCEELVADLARLQTMVESGEVAEIVRIDNASSDGSAAVVTEQFPSVTVLTQSDNLGAVGRTFGVEATTSELIAFADDDSWWEPGALAAAAQLFRAHPRLGLLHGRLLVDPDNTVDNACEEMAHGPREATLPDPSIIGHLGGGAIVRREAFPQVGGHSPLLGFGGEETLLSLDPAAHGWAQCFADSVVAHHAPCSRREDWPTRWARYRRNDTFTALLRLPSGHALRETLSFLKDAVEDPAVRREMPPFIKRLPPVTRLRRAVPAPVSARWRASRSVE